VSSQQRRKRKVPREKTGTGQGAPALPPVGELIRLVERECKNHENPDWQLTDLAVAQAYVGDHAAAWRTARSITALLWRNAALVQCWQIRFEFTGTMSELPAEGPEDPVLGTFATDFLRAECAKVLAKAGRADEAIKLLPKKASSQRSTRVLLDFHLFLAQLQADRGNKQAAADSLKQGLEHVQRLRGQPIEFVEAMIKIWLQLGDQKNAHALKSLALDLGREVRGARPEDAALTAARLAKIHALLGEKREARDSFRRAIRLEDAQGPDNEGDREFLAQRYMFALGQFGAWQLAAGFKADAAETFGKALACAKEASERDYDLLRLVEHWARAGDVEGAVRGIEGMKKSYYKSLAYCRCAEKLIKDAQRIAGKQMLDKAEALVRVETEPRNISDLFGEDCRNAEQGV